MFSCFEDFTAKFQAWTKLDSIVLSLAKRWQFYLSSDGETYAVYGGAGSLQAHHHCRCCCYCYCLLLSCHSMLTSHPEDLLVPEHTPINYSNQTDLFNNVMWHGSPLHTVDFHLYPSIPTVVFGFRYSWFSICVCTEKSVPSAPRDPHLLRAKL